MRRVWLIIVSIGFLMIGTEAKAAGENVHFGSESYAWKLGEQSPIGIYAASEQIINTAEMEIQYDADMLEYVSGGELVERGLVKIRVSGAAGQEYKEMLNFVPRVSGATQILIKNSHIQTVSGEEADMASVSVPVTIPVEAGCALSGITVNGQAVSGFSPDNTEYEVEVAADVEQAEIVTKPSDVEAEISETTLAEGENRISITTMNASGQKARYTLIVTKPEQAEKEEQRIQEKPAVIMEGDADSADRNQFLMTTLLVMLIVILAMLIIIKIQLVKKKKRRRRKGIRAKTDKKGDDFHDSDLEISVRNVTMEFKREKDEATSIKELLIRTIKKQHSYEMFKALDDISFDVYKGEVVGIIGTNGSGKSTILKIISGVLAPTKGKVFVDKNKIQLLTLGTGFDYELTGRENVYLNGAVIGYTKEYIDEKYDDIVRFAELEGFMEEKVRNYSSGMVSRLGFAIATVRDTPEILILDEVLSVGDMFFRQKSEARIREMMHGGSTVLIVSHSTSVIRNNCTKAVWIEKGKLRMAGEAEQVCSAYESMDAAAR